MADGLEGIGWVIAAFAVAVVVLVAVPAMALARYPTQRAGRDRSPKDRDGGAERADDTADLAKSRQVSLWRGFLLIATLVIAYPLIAASFGGLFQALRTGEHLPIFITYGYAWAAYVIMGGFWIAGVRLGGWFPWTGTLAGAVGVATAAPMLITLPFLLPAVVVAVRMARFHTTRPPA